MRIDTQIARVTVYRNGALVVRCGVAPPGRVEVGGLPLRFSSETLRVRPRRGVVRHLRESCRLVLDDGVPHADDERQRILEAKIEDLIDAVRRVDARLQVYRGLGPGAPPEDEPPFEMPDADAFIALHGIATDRIATLEERRAELEQQRRECMRQRAAIVSAASRDEAPPRFTRGVTFELVADSSTDAADSVAFEVEYFVDAARWRPAYVLDVADGRATLRLDARVAQATGEDWTDARIAVATADLDRETTLPPLDRWRIGTAGASRPPDERPLPDNLSSLFDAYVDGGFGDAVVDVPPDDDLDDEPTWVESESTSESWDDFAAELEAPPEATLSVDEIARGPQPPVRAAPAMMAMRPAPMAPSPAAAQPGAMSLAIGPGDLARLRGAAAPSSAIATDVAPPDARGAQRWRHAYLRLARPDESGRGRLWPVNPLDHLTDLLEGHEADAPEHLRRAVAALESAADRLRNAADAAGRIDDAHHQVLDAPGRKHVPTDGQWHRVPVRTDAADAAIVYRAVPRAGRDVYRFCCVDLGDTVAWPSGPLDVFLDGVFHVTSTLGAGRAVGRLELGMGVEPAVRVVDRKVAIEQSDKGIVTSKTRVEHRIEVIFRSSLPIPVTVEIYDRLPVPAEGHNDEIDIELLSSSPRAETRENGPDDAPLEGAALWRLPVPAGETATLEYVYRIVFPSKLELAGGNRRE